MAQVVLEHVEKSFGNTVVIKTMSLDIKDREFLVLVGPSGCGKSTVLRMIAGLETPTKGTIRIGDRVVNDVSPKDRDIAMVFQSYALYPHMTVKDNMAFGLKMRKYPKDEITRRVDEAAKLLDISHLLDRKPKALSGGQRQRVALGRAIVRDPKVFLMDEPLSNLDAKLRGQMRTEIKKLHNRLNATTIYVTHDQVEAMTMGDRIVVLNQGIIQQIGEPEVIYAQPANMFVGNFIGLMSFLEARYADGTLTLDNGHTWQVPGDTASRLNSNGANGKSLKVGIRPEHFELPQPGQQTIEVTPDLVEILGHTKQAHFTLGDKPLMATLPFDADVHEGRPITLGIDLSQASYFDASDRNVLYPAQAPVAV